MLLAQKAVGDERVISTITRERGQKEETEMWRSFIIFFANEGAEGRFNS